jgi:hypothetical protein
MSKIVTKHGLLDEEIVALTGVRLHLAARDAASGLLDVYYDGKQGIFAPSAPGVDAMARDNGYLKLEDSTLFSGVAHEEMQKWIYPSQ